MTPGEIRAEAIERIARADYTAWLERVRDVSDRWDEPCEHLPWEDAPDEGEWGRDHWRRLHARTVDALGDLLPVAEVRRPKTTEVASRAEVRHLTVGIERAFITEWQEVQ